MARSISDGREHLSVRRAVKLPDELVDTVANPGVRVGGPDGARVQNNSCVDGKAVSDVVAQLAFRHCGVLCPFECVRRRQGIAVEAPIAVGVKVVVFPTTGEFNLRSVCPVGVPFCPVHLRCIVR